MSKKVIQTITADNVETLIDALRTLSLADSNVVYVEGSNGEPVKLSLIEETLSDRSIVYSIVISEAKG